MPVDAHKEQLYWRVCVGVCLLFAVLVGIGSIILKQQAGQGTILMPLDDVYIHFQYAKQMALGHAFHYNTTDLATSGATSFIYTPLLAVGYRLGFTALQLGIWSTLIGGVALWATLCGVWVLLRAWGVSVLWRSAGGVLLATNGALLWHTMSGMETGLVIAAMLWTLAALAGGWRRIFIVSAVVLALCRPEAGIMAVLASLWALWLWRHETSLRQKLALCLPSVSIGLQPLVNLLVTGSAVATGNQSKSILGSVPLIWSDAISRMADQFLRIGWELLTGMGRDGYYVPIGLGLLALCGLGVLLRQRRTMPYALLIGLWLLALGGAIATLDNAFWHFKRYQMPLIVVCFPLAIVAADYAWRSVRWRRVILAVCVTYGAWSLVILQQFMAYDTLNVGYVHDQPYAMALWLRENTPAESVIAVHDVGMMRYIGERDTLDMVGLTSAGASAFWRNGVGSVGEWLLQEQPDYIASYGAGHGYGLGMLQATGLMRDALATFAVDLAPVGNVALAADTQAIYAPPWSDFADQQRSDLHQTSSFALFNTQAYTVVDVLNVASITSEQAHHYQWDGVARGFTTDIYEVPTVGGVGMLMDGARRMTGGETFTLANAEGGVRYLVSRIHPLDTGLLEISVNGQPVATRTIPSLPGHWLELVTRLPESLSGDTLTITMRYLGGGIYSSAMHFLVTTEMPPTASDAPSQAVFGEGWFALTRATLDESGTLALAWNVLKERPGDLRMFLHVYGDMQQPPLVQSDGYPLAGGLPPGNWLAGALFDTMTVDTHGLPAGEYRVAIGFYDVQTQARLPVTASALTVLDNRLFIGKIVVP